MRIFDSGGAPLASMLFKGQLYITYLLKFLFNFTFLKMKIDVRVPLERRVTLHCNLLRL